MKKAPVKLIKPPAEGEFKIRVGIGVEVGFVKLGPAWDDADHVLDTRVLPWPVADGIVDMVFAAFYLHRLPLPERHVFIEEVWRILKPGAQARLVVPYWTSARAKSDPLAHFPEVTEASFDWYKRQWREAERMQHDMPLECDFHAAFGYELQGDYLQGRNETFTQHAMAHELNTVSNLHVTLTKPDA